MVLRVEKKLFVIEQPISLAPPADSKYLRSEMRFMMLIMRLLFLRSEGKPVSPYVIKMKSYVAQLERLGYVLPQDLSVGLILNGVTSDFVGFVRKYNKHNMWKMIGELHALLIEYEKGLPKEAATPQVMAIQGGRIQKANKKSLNAKGKEHPTQDDTRHHCKEVGCYKRNCPAYLAEFIKKKKQVGTASSSDIFTIKALRSDRGDEYISQEFKEYLKACGIFQQLTPPYTPQHNGMSERRNRTLLDIVRSMMNLTTLPLSFWDYALESATRLGCEGLVKRDTPDKLQQRFVKCIFIGYPKETMGYYFYFPPENKIVVARYAEFLEKNLISQEVSGRAGELEEIQDEDTSPSEITSEIPMEVEGFEPPYEEEALVCRSVRTHQAPECLCLNVEVEEHSLGILMNLLTIKLQSMKDNQVWLLVDLPHNCKTGRSKWLIKKKTDMDGNVHTYKARLVAKGLKKQQVSGIKDLNDENAKEAEYILLHKQRWKLLDLGSSKFKAWSLEFVIGLFHRCFEIIDLEPFSLSFDFRLYIQRISLTGFPAQSVGSSNTDVLDLPCLLVLITGTSQSRQHVDTSLIHIESRKSPTAVLFDDDTGRISIRHCTNTTEIKSSKALPKLKMSFEFSLS
ncbi:retrotransposon protein, putative, ty1-copia subclass [Tanacetum coccineum]